jgi:hypothetical protein
MHEYCDPPDRGTTGFQLLMRSVVASVVIGCFLTMGIYTAVETLNLRARVEALEEAMSQPIELELIIPGEFEIEPIPAPRKGRDC